MYLLTDVGFSQGVALRERVIIELADIYRSTHKQRAGPTPLQSDLGRLLLQYS